MKPAPFAYSRPESVAQALALLGEDAKVLAGGQSLVPLLNLRLAAPERIVDINRLGELGYVRVGDGQVTVGALARHAAVLADQAVTTAQPLITRALRHVAHPAIRNRGTVLGSIVHADPAGEMPAVLALLGGSVRLASSAGERVVRASAFFLGPLDSDVRPGELAVEATFPVRAAGEGTAFAEISRRRGDFALCGVAALARLDASGRPALARAAYLGVAGAPVVLDLSDACSGAAADADGGLAAAGRLAMGRLNPQSDIHASAAYRRHLAGVLTERALAGAIADARERRHG